LSSEATPFGTTADADGPALTQATLSLPLFTVRETETAVFRLVECDPNAQTPLEVLLQVLDQKGQVLAEQAGRVARDAPAVLTFKPKGSVVARGSALVLLGPGSVRDPREGDARIRSLALSEEIFGPRPAAAVVGVGTGGRGDQVVPHDLPTPPIEPVRIYGVGPYSPITSTE